MGDTDQSSPLSTTTIQLKTDFISALDDLRASVSRLMQVIIEHDSGEGEASKDWPDVYQDRMREIHEAKSKVGNWDV